MSADAKFHAAFGPFKTQVLEATHFWFSAAAMNEAARNSAQVYKAINLTPRFWIAARLALEQQAIIAVAKSFGPRRSNPHNIDNLFAAMREVRVLVFGKAALAVRKEAAGLTGASVTQFMKSASALTVTDIRRLHAASTKHRRAYEDQFQDIRNLEAAHLVLVDEAEKYKKHQKTSIRDLEKMIVFLCRLVEAIRRSYDDGRRLSLPSMRYSSRSLGRTTLSHLSGLLTQESIVRDTRRCMELLAHASKNPPAGFNRSSR